MPKAKQDKKAYPQAQPKPVRRPDGGRSRRHLNIELITYADLESVRGQPGHFTVTINKRPRYVDPEKCTGCGRGWIERLQQKRW